MTNVRRLALVLAALSPRLAFAAPPLHLDVDLEAGEVGLWDSATTGVPAGNIDSKAYMPVLGVAARVQPWRGLVLRGEYRFGTGTTLDTPAVSPTRTDVGYWRYTVDGGWRFDTPSLGAVRSLTATVGYGRERWSSQQQSLTRQITPSFGRGELRVRGEADARLAAERLDVRAGLAVIPLLGVSEDFATNGTDSSGWGFDLDARASYDLGNLLGRFGDLEVGIGADFGMRWISWSGQGTRTTLAGQRVSDVSEHFTRLTGLALVTWVFPGALAGGREEEPERAEVVGREIRIKSTIYFNPASATLDLPRSRRAIRAVVQVMHENPGIKVEVRGHTDNQGEPAANRQLSLKRAQAVVDAMVGMGIDRDRLEAKGFGETRPIADNKTAAGREANRRVEFVIP